MTDPQTVLRQFMDEAWNKRDLDAFPRYVSDKVRFHPPRGEPLDYDGYLKMARAFQGAFSDLHFETLGTFGDATHAAARIVITGTNDGPFRQWGPTGKRVRVVGRPMARVENGKIVEFWQLFDELGMLQQLGHVPA
ncbi:MAG TPA: ester cyclase [Candidatus Thermoplasmatota archaeon]|nr:ester cyclase [Candidatus Thermoplasmatota archaeon]